MIPLSKPFAPPKSVQYVQEVLQSGKLVGQGPWTKRCEQWLERMMTEGKAFLVTSGTTALEMAAMIVDISAGDEVIFPSYTFVSTVNAFVARGAVPVFVDIEEGTMNMDASKVEAAITPKTKAIVPVHYAGISCDMNHLMDIATLHNLVVIEDAAQSLTSKHYGRFSGTIGHIGCVSFHETKNFTSGGQGGAVLVNRRDLVDHAEVVYDNGTNRVQFIRGNIAQYEWQDVGSNYILSEVLAALLWSQLELANDIQKRRLEIWHKYHASLQSLAEVTGFFEVPKIPLGCEVNGHIYYLKLKNSKTRDKLVAFMKENGISVTPHYAPLHLSSIGKRIGRFVGRDHNTTMASGKLVRLPIYHELGAAEQEKVLSALQSFFGSRNAGRL